MLSGRRLFQHPYEPVPEKAALVGKPTSRISTIQWCCLAALVTIGITSVSPLVPKYVSSNNALNENSATCPIKVIVSNVYSETEFTKGTRAQNVYVWLQSRAWLVEPYRTTTLEAVIDLSAASPADSHSSLHWTIVRRGGEDKADRLEGSSVEHFFKDLGTYDVFVSYEDARYTCVMICRYVRREIRDLFEKDREMIFDTMRQMMDISTSRGVALFGSQYRDYNHFVRQHQELTGRRDGDQLHDGMGFLTAHMAQSNSFERAMQAVDPSIAMPFWDFTIESAYAAEQDPETWSYQSDYFSTFSLWNDKWFGDAENSEMTVRSGRWAYLEVPKAQSPTAMQSPYGYLRAPWNFQASPYMIRSHKLCGADAFEGHSSLKLISEPWPSCQTHHDVVFNKNVSTWQDWAWTIQYAPHGHVHTVIGGTTDCAKPYDDLEGVLNTDDLRSLRVASFTSLRNIWRRFPDRVFFPAYCAVDAPTETCSPSCDMDSIEENQELRDAMFHAVFDWVTVKGTYDATAKQAVLSVVCSTGLSYGEQTEASSPLDPSFHFMHPTLERLWQFRMLTGGFENMEWGDDNTCIWGECTGHHAGDLVPGSVFYEEELDGGGVFVSRDNMTHVELRDAADPSFPRMSYVYGDFEWAHCRSQGLSFADSWVASIHN